MLFSGKYEDLLASSTQTAEYLSMRKSITRRNPITKSPKKFIEIYGAVENNLKNINVRIPLECMTVVTGVSGGGKSSLIIDILSNYLMNYFYPSSRQIGRHDRVE